MHIRKQLFIVSILTFSFIPVGLRENLNVICLKCLNTSLDVLNYYTKDFISDLVYIPILTKVNLMWGF